MLDRDARLSVVMDGRMLLNLFGMASVGPATAAPQLAPRVPPSQAHR